MLIARDIMVPDTPTLSFDTSVAKAIVFFHETKFPFVAVSASQDRFHGVLTEAIMVKIFFRHQKKPEKKLLIHYRDLFETPTLIQETEPFSEIVKKLMTGVGHRAFVINETCEVIGHITTKDILPYFAQAIKHKKLSEKHDAATDFIRQLDDMRSNLYLYESFFSKSPFLMHSIRPDGQIQMANEILHSVLKYPFGELIGKSVFDLYPPANHEYVISGMKKIFQEGYNRVQKAQMLTKTRDVVEVEMFSSSLNDQDKNPVGTITISRPLDMEYLLANLPTQHQVEGE